MKIVKMSLVAALLVGSSAFAVENIQMSGDAQIVYQTTDAKGQTSNILVGNTGSGTLFDKDSSAADAGLNLNITADLAKNDLVTVSTGAGYTVLSTLGLENNFVSNVWGGAHTATFGTKANYAETPAIGGAKVENANWLNEGWVAVTTGKTTAKLGRMELDTPLAFTEKWSIEKNTFEAAVLMNQNIQDTTLVAAYVGNGNGTEIFGQNANSNVSANALAVGGVANRNGEFTTYGENGAYALGAINNSFKPLTAQAWYYDVSKLAQAYWLQADVKCSLVNGLLIGGQYTGVTLDKGSFTGQSLGLTKDTSSGAMAAMLGYEVKDMVTVKGAYSSVDTDFSAGFNTATSTGTAQSKLYTETWWSYGQITQADTSAMNLTVTSPVQGIIDLGLYITSVDHKPAKTDMTEMAVTAAKSFGPLDTMLVLVNTNTDGGDSVNYVQAYLKLKF